MKASLASAARRCVDEIDAVHLFFGEPFADGLKGMVSSADKLVEKSSTENLHLFGEPDSKQPPDSDVRATISMRLPAHVTIKQIAVASSGCVAAVIEGLDDIEHRLQEQTHSANRLVLTFDDMEAFRDWIGGTPEELAKGAEAMAEKRRCQPLASPAAQLVASTTVFTLFTQDGRVLTWATDPRYPSCLGRPGAPDGVPFDLPGQVEYLSETRVRKVASAGWMTAAVSDDGELYVWGTATPKDTGTRNEVSVLRKPENDEEDDFVRVADVRIDGREARVVDVAVGEGHIVVAAEATKDAKNDAWADRKTRSAVFTAGEASHGQLGLGVLPPGTRFIPELTEVPGLRDKKVLALTAAGWSTWVVVEGSEVEVNTSDK